MSDAHARFLGAAEALGLAVELRARPEAPSLAEAAAGIGATPNDVVKSLVVRRHGGDFLFVLVPGDRQISWPKLRAHLGVNKLSMPSAEKALEATGYVRGTITPVGSTTAWPVILDGDAAGRRISIGAGALGVSAFVDSAALVDVLGATVADVTDPID